MNSAAIDIGDVALHGIQEYEQSINDNNDNVQNQNAFNLNVNMNLSPVNDIGRNDENMNINPENTCYFEADGDEKNNIKISQTKTSDRQN
jgi:flagellar basal body L-ring protein FlgH